MRGPANSEIDECLCEQAHPCLVDACRGHLSACFVRPKQCCQHQWSLHDGAFYGGLADILASDVQGKRS